MLVLYCAEGLHFSAFHCVPWLHFTNDIVYMMFEFLHVQFNYIIYILVNYMCTQVHVNSGNSQLLHLPTRWHVGSLYANDECAWCTFGHPLLPKIPISSWLTHGLTSLRNYSFISCHYGVALRRFAGGIFHQLMELFFCQSVQQSVRIWIYIDNEGL